MQTVFFLSKIENFLHQN